MNTDFDQIADSLKHWDTEAKDTLGAIASYQKLKELMPEPKTNADLIVAGVHSCLLALDTIEELEKFDHPRPQAMIAAAHGVLKHWGLEIKATAKPEASVAEAPVSASPPAAPELIWPPPEPTLPAIYTENYYLVRDLAFTDPMMVAKLEAADPLQPLTDTTLASGTQLSFLGTARWSSEHGCWLMRMHLSITPAMGNNLWVFSKALKPGDEIPKVVDSATLAGNNDP